MSDERTKLQKALDTLRNPGGGLTMVSHGFVQPKPQVDPSMRFTTIFEFGAVRFSVDGRGVGHVDFGQGSSVVSRNAIRTLLQDAAKEVADARTRLQAFEINLKKEEPNK